MSKMKLWIISVGLGFFPLWHSFMYFILFRPGIHMRVYHILGYITSVATSA